MSTLRSTAAIVGCAIGVDQATKVLAASSETASESFEPVTNPEALLGIIGGSRLFLLALGVAALVVFGAYLTYLVRVGLPGWVAGLLIGGAISNLLDRAFLGAVRDFVHLPGIIVNLADLALLTGALGIMAHRPSEVQGRQSPPLVVPG